MLLWIYNFAPPRQLQKIRRSPFVSIFMVVWDILRWKILQYWVAISQFAAFDILFLDASFKILFHLLQEYCCSPLHWSHDLSWSPGIPYYNRKRVAQSEQIPHSTWNAAPSISELHRDSLFPRRNKAEGLLSCGF